jgi:hypothetical protein
MPRYVLIEFESNEAAERFVVKTLEREQQGAAYKVIGFFAKPRGFCKCGPLSERLQAAECRRGSKYGWMVHTKCGRPRRQASHSPRNLLDPDGTHASRVASFLHLVGAWAGEDKLGTILPNFPIAVRTREDDR